MMMKALIPAILLLAIQTGSPQPIAPAEQIPATIDVSAMKKLDEILDRLKAIEDRLDRIEATVDQSSSWQMDQFGILRDSCGRPVGYWGIDVNS